MSPAGIDGLVGDLLKVSLQFFAFTATPKGRTLELFGQVDPDTGKHAPFHLYSMRQAIEEKFIHDVLANYVTYQTYWHIEKAIEDDPKYDTEKAKQLWDISMKECQLKATESS